MLIKCFLHISADDQKERLLERLDDPTKHWKYNPGDLDERALWDDYQDAYAIALERCSTDAAPWHVVPSRTQVVSQLGRGDTARWSTWVPSTCSGRRRLRRGGQKRRLAAM